LINEVAKLNGMYDENDEIRMTNDETIFNEPMSEKFVIDHSNFVIASR